MPTKSEQLLEKSKTFEQQLKCFILAELERMTAGSSSTGLATEATLTSVLNAIVASDQDIEVLLVRDTVTLIVYKQITDWPTRVAVVSYTDVDGVPFVPVNPMIYLDPSSVLNLILAQNTAINTKLNDALGGDGTEFIYATTGVVSGKAYKYLVANADCTFTTLTDSAAVDLKIDLGITTDTVSKGMIIRAKSGKTIAAVTMATGSVIGVN